MTEQQAASLPARLLRPWIEDNAVFIQSLTKSGAWIENVPNLRDKLLHEGRIKMALEAQIAPLAAVDAAVAKPSIGDQVSILIQVVCVTDKGDTTFGEAARSTGVNGHEMELCSTPMRVAAECTELSTATSPTIADTSYWSFLMEANQAITRCENSSNAELGQAVKRLVDEQVFLMMLRNQNIVPMSKLSESDTEIKGVSDREVFSRILQPGEYTAPISLTHGTSGKFGVEQRGFKSSERDEILELYNKRLGVLFFKPHAWTRAYRIEGHLGRLHDNSYLMPLLAAVARHTTVRTIVEPFPQFLADYTAKQLSAVAMLYGDLNRYRMDTSSIPIRTDTRRR